MSTRILTLIFALPLLAACTDSEPVAPTADDAASILAAKGGKPDKPGGGGDPGVTITETDLGTLEGSSGLHHFARSVVSGPDSSSASVRVVGESDDRAFYWTPGGGMVELQVPNPTGSAFLSLAYDINDADQVVGYRFVDRGDPDLNGSEAVLWKTPGEVSVDLVQMTPRPLLSEARAINNRGVVVGLSFYHQDYVGHAMIWRLIEFGNVIDEQDIHGYLEGELGVYSYSFAEDINDRGQVVGYGWDGAQNRAFLWVNGVVTFLEDGESHAYAINNADPVQIVGYGGPDEPVVWTVTVDSDGSGSILRTDVIPPLPRFDGVSVYEADITDDGKIAGWSGGHATLWTINPDGTIDALDLTPDLPARETSRAFGIDNSAALAGVVRVVGGVYKASGRNRTGSAKLWTVRFR